MVLLYNWGSSLQEQGMVQNRRSLGLVPLRKRIPMVLLYNWSSSLQEQKSVQSGRSIGFVPLQKRIPMRSYGKNQWTFAELPHHRADCWILLTTRKAELDILLDFSDYTVAIIDEVSGLETSRKVWCADCSIGEKRPRPVLYILAIGERHTGRAVSTYTTNCNRTSQPTTRITSTRVLGWSFQLAFRFKHSPRSTRHPR